MYIVKKVYLCTAKKKKIIIMDTTMKKLISSVLVVVMALGMNTAKADNISMEEAREAAAYFMAYYTGVDKLTTDDLELVYQIDNEKLGIPASYFFNLASDGWIIMAGTTTIDPIIGYNTEGSLDPDCFPANMRWWVNGYSDMVSEIQELDAENDYPDHEMWTSLKNRNYKGDTKEAQHILMSEKWGQGDDITPTYNYYCPQTITSGRYAIAGCVATAMSQIFHYYRFPRKGTGMASYYLPSQLSHEDSASTMPRVSLKYNFNDSVEFNYGMMPNVPTKKVAQGYYYIYEQNCTDEEMHEIARLMYACGVSVKMSYLPDGSGAMSANVPGAAASYFKYKRGRENYRSGNTDWAYVSALRSALMANNVLYMAGASSTGTGGDASGHAWVCGGYKETDTNRYFMNWGWDGSSNGFYNLGANSMPISQQGYNFNVRQEYISGMVPDSSQMGISDIEDLTYLGQPYPNPAMESVTLPYSTQSISDLVIYGIDGRPVKTYRVQPGSGKLEVRVDALPAGVYIYRLNSLTGKFIVQ